MLRRIAKVIIWLAGGIFAITLLLYLVTVVVNWSDALPSASAKHFTELRAQLPQVADEQNAFIYLVGVSVDAGSEPFTSGLAMVKQERKRPPAASLNGYNPPDFPQGDAVKISSKAVLELFDACSEKGAECLAFLASDKVANIEFGPSEKLLLTRYRTLIAFPHWRDNDFSPEGLIPAYSPALNGQKLALFYCWEHALRYGRKDVSAQLEADARFWRDVLDSSDSLITSMIATAALRNNLFWSNLIMRRFAEVNSHIDVSPTWQRPLSDKERLMERAWAGEWVFAAKVISNIKANGSRKPGEEYTFTHRLEDRLLQPLFQPQDTLNRHADTFVSLMAKFQVPYEQLPEVVAKMNRSPVGFGEGLSFPHMFYNPIGKIVNAIGTLNYEDYMLKVADLEGARRALLATAALRDKHIPREKAAEALTQLPLRNPYTNQPFAWDEATGSVQFDGLSKGKHRHYLFPY